MALSLALAACKEQPEAARSAMILLSRLRCQPRPRTAPNGGKLRDAAQAAELMQQHGVLGAGGRCALCRWVLAPVVLALAALARGTPPGSDALTSLARLGTWGVDSAYEALEISAGDLSTRWAIGARLGSRRLFGSAEADLVRLRSAATPAWALHCLARSSVHQPNPAQRGVRSSRKQPAGLGPEEVAAEKSTVLQPIFFEVDRSSHAERQALLRILKSTMA